MNSTLDLDVSVKDFCKRFNIPTKAPGQCINAKTADSVHYIISGESVKI